MWEKSEEDILLMLSLVSSSSLALSGVCSSPPARALHFTCRVWQSRRMAEAGAARATVGLWRDLLLSDATMRQGREEGTDIEEEEEEDEEDEEEDYCTGEEAESENDSDGQQWQTPEDLLRNISSLKSYQVVRVPRTVKSWIRAGNELTKESVDFVITRLKQQKRFEHALEVAKWLKESKPFARNEEEEIVRLELYSHCGSLSKAEKIFKRLLPEQRSEAAHNALLLAYVKKKQVPGAERIYKQMRKLGMLSSSYTFNLMAMLYRQKKLEERILPLVDEACLLGVELETGFKNNLLLAKCKVEGISAAEELFSRMVSQRSDSFMTFATMADCYIAAGLTSNAENMLRLAEEGLETGKLKQQRRHYTALVSMYATLGNVAGMERAWRSLVEFRAPITEDYYCMIKACAKVGDVDRAEAVFKEAEANDSSLKFSPIFNALMFAYSTVNAIDRAESLKWRMEEELCVQLDNWCYHHLVSLYCRSGNVDKAARLLKRAQAAGKEAREAGKRRASRLMPFPWTLWLVLDAYANLGNVDAAEAALNRWKKAGYRLQAILYNRLLRAYVVAGRPADKFVERMLEDRVRPNAQTQELFNQLKAKLLSSPVPLTPVQQS